MTVTCPLLRLSHQPYYRWLVSPVTDTEVVEAYRANALLSRFEDDPEFGYRLLTDEVLMRVILWRTVPHCGSRRPTGGGVHSGKKRARNGKKPGPAVHDDQCTVTDENGRVRHEFTADGPNSSG